MTAIKHEKPRQEQVDPMVLPSPRYHPEVCAAKRGGIAGCRACADVCPHEALRFTDTGPKIETDACQRCGACTAACPVGALERSYLPDAELFGLVATAAAARPSLLILTCNHDSPAQTHLSDGCVRLTLPCIQLVSDDLLLFALARGARALRVEPSPSCPHGPHRQPTRAVEMAQSALEGRGWDGSCIEMGSARGAIDTTLPVGPEPVVILEPSGLRYERRMALLDAMGTGPKTPRTLAAPKAVPWRRTVVDQGKCTTCGSCAFVCPTGALGLGEGGAALYGRESACIGCELCARTCPEKALSLLPVVPMDNESRLLVRSEVKGCTRCGRPLLPEPLVRRIEKKLLRAEAASRAALRLCESCKGTQPFEPAALKPLPPEKRESRRSSEECPPGRADETFPTLGESGLSRREFVRIAGAAATAAVALGGCSADLEAGEQKRRYGMVIDTKRCVGCQACVIACKAENKTPPGVNYMLVTNNTLGKRPDDKPLFTAKPCFHCEKPPCVDVCPVSATFKRKQDGIVVVDYDRCIGCRYCQTACPYGARYFDFGESYHAETAGGAYNPPSPEYNQYRPRTHGASPIGNVRKCTFCMHLQDEKGEYDKNAGRWPACAKTCTGHAIHFGDFKDPDGDLVRLIRERQPVRLKDELGAEPNVVYLL